MLFLLELEVGVRIVLRWAKLFFLESSLGEFLWPGGLMYDFRDSFSLSVLEVVAFEAVRLTCSKFAS